MDEKGITRMDLLEEIESVLGDAGGPGEFKYDGGPKPYVKKDGTTSKTSQERVDSVNEGQQAIPVPNQEQIAQAAALVQKYYDSKDSGILTEMQEAMRVYSDKAWSHGYGTPEYYEFQEKRETLYKQFKDILYPPSTQEPEEFQSGLENQQSQIKRLRDSIVENNPTTRYLSKDAKNFDQVDSLTKEEYDAIESFTQDATDFHNYAEADEIRSAMDKFKLKNDIVVHRGIHSARGTFVSSFLEAQPGDILHNEHFSSTSLGKQTAHVFKGFHGGDEEEAVLHITVPKGSRVLPINQTFSGLDSSDLFHQREVVLDKNSKFRIDSVNKKSRSVNLTLLKEGVATDSLAIDYTFIPEEHPRQKDPDWGGKPQEPGQPKEPLTVPFPTGKQLDAANELVEKYYDTKANHIQSLMEKEAALYSHVFSAKYGTPAYKKAAKKWGDFLDSAEYAPYSKEVEALRENTPKSESTGEPETEESWQQYLDENKTKVSSSEGLSPEDALAQRREEIKEQVLGHEFDFSGAEEKSIASWIGKFDTHEKITPEDEDALGEFVAGGVYTNQIQGYLITGKNPADDKHALSEENIKMHSDNLSKMTEKWSSNRNLKLYRGVTSGEYGVENSEIPHRKEFVESLINSSPGDVLHNKAFSSFSFSRDATGGYGHPARGGVTLQLNLRKGQNGVPVNDVFVTHNATNREVVIDKNSKFKVESVDKTNRHVVLSLQDKEPAEQAKSEKESDFSPEHEAEVKKLHDELAAEKPEVIKSIESRTDLTPQQREQRLSDVEKTYDSYKLQEESRNKITKQFGLTNRYSPPVYSGEQEAKAEHFSSPELTNEHHKLIDYFTRDSTPMNDYLHNESKSKNKTSERIKALSDLINSSKTNQDTRVFRGINSGLGDKERDELHEALLEAKPGEIINNKGFVSTTTYPDEGIRFAKTGTRKALLSISLKKGHPALHLSHGSMGDQGEVVLDKGTRFEIESVDKKNKVIKVSVIPNDKPITTDSAPLNSVDWRYANHQLQYVIETPKGTLRIGHGWQRRMPADYGYIIGFTGADGDEIDCYLGPNPWSQIVYVVDQNQINSKIFDEHKCLIGFASESEAKRCYLMGHHMGDKIFRGIKALSMREFINWLQRGNLTQPITR